MQVSEDYDLKLQWKAVWYSVNYSPNLVPRAFASTVEVGENGPGIGQSILYNLIGNI